MCEFLDYDGADYRQLPPNGGVDDLVTLWKTKAPAAASAASRAPKARVRAQLQAPRRQRPDLGLVGREGRS